MAYKKGSGLKRIIVVVIVLIFGLTLLFWAASAFFGSEAEVRTAEGVSEENKPIQPNEEIPDEQSGNSDNLTKYMTVSQNNNIDISVNYLSPVNKEKDILTFNIAINTHSVDLTEYEDIRKYVELQTDAGVTISDGFEWNLESSEGHHVSGILKIKNDFEGNPIIDSNTKSFKLLFNNIGDGGTREHVYEGDKLK